MIPRNNLTFEFLKHRFHYLLDKFTYLDFYTILNDISKILLEINIIYTF